MDNDERVTLRMDTGDLQELDDYLADHRELGNRSQFIRTAVREYINRDADVAAVSKDGLFIRFTESEMAAMDIIIKKGIFLDPQEFVRHVMRDKLCPQKTLDDSIASSFALSSSEAMMK